MEEEKEDTRSEPSKIDLYVYIYIYISIVVPGGLKGNSRDATEKSPGPSSFCSLRHKSAF